MNGSSNRCAPPRLPFFSSGRLASSHARSSLRNCASSAVSLRSMGRSVPPSDPSYLILFCEVVVEAERLVVVAVEAAQVELGLVFGEVRIVVFERAHAVAI